MMLRLGRENGSIILSQFFGFINFLHIYLCHLVQFLQSFLVEFQCRDPPEPLGLWHLDLILSVASEKRKKNYNKLLQVPQYIKELFDHRAIIIT